jgi:hypothetical protein
MLYYSPSWFATLALTECYSLYPFFPISPSFPLNLSFPLNPFFSVLRSLPLTPLTLPLSLLYPSPSTPPFTGIPQLVTSVVPVSARFAKLKAELVNILYTLPEKPMRWVDKDEIPAVPATATDTAIAATSSAVTSAVVCSDTAAVVVDTASTAMDTTAPSSSSSTAEAVSSEMDVVAETISAPAEAATETTTDVTPSPSLEVEVALTIPKPLPISSSSGTLDPNSTPQENADKSIEMTVTADASSSSYAAVAVSGDASSTSYAAVAVSDDASSSSASSSSSSALVTVSATVEVPKETKVERKLKRRLKRRQNNERVMGLIQSAATPQQLLEVLIEIEEAIPKTYKYSLNDEALPSTADTCAALAVRVYVLDRRIRYDEIKELEKQGMDRQYKPRYHFAPRCLMSSSCTKFLSHTGKCTNDSPLLSGTGSRIPDINDNLSNYANINAAYLQQRASAAALQSR